jgi:hypothetical protein
MFLQDQQMDFIGPLHSLQESFQTGNQPYPRSADDHPNAIGHSAIAATVLSEIEKHHCGVF